MKRRRLWISPLLTVALAVVAAAVLPPRPTRSQPPAPPLNILLITLDTTRADRLGCYGYKKAETPCLDALAASGVRFEQAFTHVPLTLPAHATILTGLHPPEHGLHDNGRGRLAPEPAVLAEIFAEHGYRTAAFVSSFVLDRTFGLERGFDVYEDEMTSGTGGENPYDQENRADVTCARALAWLGANPGQPFFCWVHFYDPHLPYDPPEPYRTRLDDPYDGEIAFMDAYVKQLIDFLDRSGLRHHTLVIACGDHGEAFGEHEETGHGGLVYDTTMRVPLVLSLPGRVPRAKSVDRVVGLVDIAQTVLDVLGWPHQGHMNGRSLLSDDVPSGRACFGESEFLFNSHGWAPLYSLTTAQWHYIECPKPELYNRVADPQELTNLANEKPGIRAALQAELALLRTVLQKGQAAELELDPQAIATLRQLGYLGGPSAEPTAAPDPARLKDPKSMMTILSASEEAKRRMAKGEFREVIGLLEPLVRRSPESVELHRLLAESYLPLGEFAAARRHIDACLAFRPTDRTMLANLVTVLLETRQHAEAAEKARGALRLAEDPAEPAGPGGISRVTARLRVGLAAALTELGRLEDAAEQYDLVLKEDPDHVEANAGLADVSARQGKNELAVQHYRRALDAAPATDGASLHLGLVLCSERRYADALAAWRQGLEHRPNDPELMRHLAWWLATCPDPKARDGREAARLAESLCKLTQWTSADALDVLAAAHAEAGDFGKAVELARTALSTARAAPASAALVTEIERRLALYRASKPYHQ